MIKLAFIYWFSDSTICTVRIVVMSYTASSIKIVSKQSGKVEYEREMLAGNR